MKNEKHTILHIQCMYCGCDMGTKDGKGTTGITSSICEPCFTKHFPDMEYVEVKK